MIFTFYFIKKNENYYSNSLSSYGSIDEIIFENEDEEIDWKGKNLFGHIISENYFRIKVKIYICFIFNIFIRNIIYISYKSFMLLMKITD